MYDRYINDQVYIRDQRYSGVRRLSNHTRLYVMRRARFIEARVKSERIRDASSRNYIIGHAGGFTDVRRRRVVRAGEISL